MLTTVWTANLAYAVGLITSDGCLSKDKRHIDFTSKDIDQVKTFAKVLNLKNKIGRKSRGKESQKPYFRIQFGSVDFYKFLLGIGLTSNKSKTISAINIPTPYFRDFLRGYLDGDGNITIARHPESKHLQLRVRLSSASLVYLDWLKQEIQTNLKISGGFIEDKRMTNRATYLSFGKIDSIKILQFIYYKGVENYLVRKYNIALPFLLGE